MSKSKNAIQEIKKLMVQFGFLADEPTLLNFKLEDDTILEAEAIEVGKSINKINEAFEKVSLENGVYSIEGFEVEVEDGKISNVKEIFSTQTLSDGTTIKVVGAGLENGAKVYVVDEKGNSLPIGDGDHTLADGTIVTTKDGEVVSTASPATNEGSYAKDEEKGPGEKTETPAEEGAEPTSPVEDETIKKDAKLNPEQMDEMYSMLKDFVTKAHEKMAQLESSYSTLSSEFEAFKKEPAGKKINYVKGENFNKIEDEVEQKLATIMSLRNKK